MEPKFKKGDYIQHKNPEFRESPYYLQGKISGMGKSGNGTEFYYVDYKGVFVVPVESQDEYELVNR